MPYDVDMYYIVISYAFISFSICIMIPLSHIYKSKLLSMQCKRHLWHFVDGFSWVKAQIWTLFHFPNNEWTNKHQSHFLRYINSQVSQIIEMNDMLCVHCILSMLVNMLHNAQHIHRRKKTTNGERTRWAP